MSNLRERLEEGRRNLGGFGEPVWSQALTELDRLERELEEARTRIVQLERGYDEQRDLATARIARAEAAAEEARKLIADIWEHPFIAREMDEKRRTLALQDALAALDSQEERT